MPSKNARKHADDLRAVSKLAIDATKGITGVVEDMHVTIASGPRVLGRPLAKPVRAIASFFYGQVRTVTNLVGLGIDGALAILEPLLGASEPGPERDAIQSAANGVIGDYLASIESPLAIPMTFRADGRTLSFETNLLRERFPNARAKLLVMVHGSSMSDRQWTRRGHDHGAALAEEFGYTAVYLHYNSGLHISTNGREFSRLLDRLVRAWPVPVTEIAFVGHSMGGLVARSAAHAGDDEKLAWRSLLKRIVCLGSPHHGSPLERSGGWLDVALDLTSYSAPLARLGKIRSAGVTDLRYGDILDEHWEGHDRFEARPDTRRALSLPKDVACYAIAGTTATTHAEKMPGDGLVSIDSALGRHARADLTLTFPEAHLWIALGTSHLDLLSRAEVYARLREWFAPGASGVATETSSP